MALKDIRSWTDVEIRPYDKGKGFTIDYKKSYEERIIPDLQNETQYRTLNADEGITKINSDITTWIKKWRIEPEHISQKLENWMVNEEAKPGAYYQNYKAHKPPHFQEEQ